MKYAEKIEKLMLELAAEDVNEALEVATGLFVGLCVAHAEQQGHDTNQNSINVKGGEGQRNITIHALESS